MPFRPVGCRANVGPMRWERLFADLEARLEAEEAAGVAADVTDQVRAERARLAMVDRLRAHVGCELSWHLVTGAAMPGRLLDLGSDWVLLKVGRGSLLVPIWAVEAVGGLSSVSVLDGSEVARRLGIGVVLRGLSRDRALVSVGLGEDRSVTGTIDRVGVDHFDLAVHPADEPRRAGAVIRVQCLRLAAVTGIGVH